jgi:CRP/FNR family cyclic AMP-dependent transcriptional regulator
MAMNQALGFPSHKHCQVLLDFVQTGRAQLSELGRTYDVEDQATVYGYGDPVDSLYLVKAGQVRTSTLSPEGRELVTGLHGPGDMFGQFCLCQQHHRNEQAVAIEPSKVVHIGVEEIIDLAATRDGALSMLQLFCHRISSLEEQIAQLAFAKVRTRLALLLMRLAEDGEAQPDGSSVCHNGPTHEEMASRINTTREQVTTLLAQFRSAGYIDYRRTGPLRVYPARLQQDLADT